LEEYLKFNTTGRHKMIGHKKTIPALLHRHMIGRKERIIINILVP